MPAPKGNKNAVKGKEWTDALRKAMANYYPNDRGVKKGMEKLARKLIEAAENGDSWALKELGDRIEGKPAQAMTLSGDEDNPIQTKWTTEIVHINKPDSNNNSD